MSSKTTKSTRRSQITTSTSLSSSSSSQVGQASTSSIQTPQPQGSSSAASSAAAKEKSTGRSSSPLSPTRISRLQEKLELQNLNDRLATYIDRVRHLENENNRLTVQVQTTQETITREVTNIKTMYEQELSDARKLLDDTAKEKAKMQIEAGKWKSQADELQTKYNKKEKDCATYEKRMVTLETMNNDLTSRYNQAVQDRKRLEDEVQELSLERDKLAKQLSVAKAQLEDETLRRVDLENRLQSMKEELAFKENVHEKQLSETRMIKQTEISEIDNRLKDQYEQKLADTLREIREQYETQMKINRDEIEILYDAKLSDLEQQLQQRSNQSSTWQEEIRTYRSRAESLASKLADLESQNGSLQSRVKDLERMIEQERDWHLTAMHDKEEEIRKLRERLDQQLVEYHNLLDIKIALDLEIAAYRKLLESEELRLNITPSATSPADEDVSQRRITPIRRTPVRGVKRKRTIVMESEKKSTSDKQVLASAKGDIEIQDHCPDGKYVRLYNKGTKDISIGGWQLHRQAGDQETNFKFHRSVVVKPESVVTVWGSDSNVTHNPPSDVVMKQGWVISDSMVTKLLNSDGDEVAIRETTKTLSSALAERSRESGFYSGDEREDIYHQMGDPNNPQERCSIM